MIQDKLFQFLWHGRRPKIRKDVLYGKYENGGIRMVNLINKCKSLKVAWVPRISKSVQSAGKLHVYLNSLISPFDLSIVFSSNFKIHDIPIIFPKLTSQFWFQVFEAWSECTYHNPKSKREILDESLWLNSHIRIDRVPVYWPNLISKNVLKIKDLLNDNLQFYSYNDFINKYDLRCNLVSYYGLVAAIPNSWKRLLNDNNYEPLAHNNAVVNQPSWHIINSTKTASQNAYDILQKRVTTFPKHLLEKWSRDLHQEISPETLRDAFINIYKLTISSSIRAFQYKLLHRILPNNHLLYIWKIKNSESCSFCGQEVETFMHLFTDCFVVQNFWLDVKDFIQRKTGIPYSFDAYDIIFLIKKETVPVVLLSILLIGKLFIYKSRNLNPNLSIDSFVSYLNQYIRIEREIALKREKLLEHYRKWDLLDDF